MLRRNSSNRLKHRKSTSSVQSKSESIDPEVARHYAQTAATLAFNRAQERNSADANRRGGLSTRNTDGSYRQSLSQPTSSHDAVERSIKRQQSVRFAGPTAVQRRQSIGTRAVQISTQPLPSTPTLRPIAMTTNAPVPAAYRPPSRSSSIGKASNHRMATDSYLAANAFDEYYTREDDIASTPSSYRRIRRSKSMFSPLKAPSVYYTNGTPNRPEGSWFGGQGSFADYRTSQNQANQPVMRAPKSMTFLRRRRRDHNGLERDDGAIQMARDRFFQETAQQRLREQPSFLFKSKSLKQNKPFRNSVRSTSSGYGAPVASANQEQPLKESSMKEVARKAKKSIRSKLKKVFGRHKDEPVSVPNQQVDARETHVRRYNGDSTTLPDEKFSDIPRPDAASLSRVSARVPSIHAASSNQQLRSHAGSMRSLRSEQSDDKSRVTSWNSTGMNTIASQPPQRILQSDREQQRLSIINEVGTHVTSSSLNRPRLSNQFSAYPIVHRPNKSVSHVQPSTPLPVDSARIYSALMKRLDDNSPKARLDASRKQSYDSLVSVRQVPRRSSSVKSSRDNRTPVTIRQVIPEDSSTSGGSYRSARHDHQWVKADSIHSAQAKVVFGKLSNHVHQWVPIDACPDVRTCHSDDVFSPKPNSSHKENGSLDQTNFTRRSSVASKTHPRQESNRTSHHKAQESFLTPQEIAIRNEPVVLSTRVIRESKSTFFGGGSGFTIPRTQSPFRRAMAKSSENNPQLKTSDSQITFTPPLRNPLYVSTDSASSSKGSERDIKEKAYSDSIYSRTTSGQTPVAANSAASLLLDIPDAPRLTTHHGVTGDVVVLDRKTYRPAMPISLDHRVTKSAGSAEWKNWMSSEVAKLERAKDDYSTTYVNYALPTMPKSFGHVRESAQIDDADIVVTQRKASVAKQPLGIIQLNPNLQNMPVLKPILKKKSSVSFGEYREPITPSVSKIPVPPPLPPPPVPQRSLLRPMQSKSSLRSAGTINSTRTGSAPSSVIIGAGVNGRTLLHKQNASQSTLRSVKSANIKSIETPAKLVKRNGRPTIGDGLSPGNALSTTVEKHFGSASTISRCKTPDSLSKRENVAAENTPMDGPDGVEGTGLIGQSSEQRTRANTPVETSAQVMGSKTMVDMFLSSRRSRIVSASDDDAIFL